MNLFLSWRLCNCGLWWVYHYLVLTQDRRGCCPHLSVCVSTDTRVPLDFHCVGARISVCKYSMCWRRHPNWKHIGPKMLAQYVCWLAKDSRVLWADVTPCCLCDSNLPHAQSSYCRGPRLLKCSPVTNWLYGIRLLSWEKLTLETELESWMTPSFPTPAPR